VPNDDINPDLRGTEVKGLQLEWSNGLPSEDEVPFDADRRPCDPRCGHFDDPNFSEIAVSPLPPVMKWPSLLVPSNHTTELVIQPTVERRMQTYQYIIIPYLTIPFPLN
jgi:hypothetical protein